MNNAFVRIIGFWAVFMGMNLSGFAQHPTPTTIAGGPEGIQFADTDIPTGVRVLEVHIFSGDFVDAVQMLYTAPDGRVLAGPRYGGPGGQQNIFRLDSDEYIVGLSGRYGNYIDALQIRTNKRASSLFGGRGGNQRYNIDIPGGNQAVGFVGRAGEYLDAIGLTFVPLMMRVAGQTAIAGGGGGAAFADLDIPLGARVSEVRVRSGNVIDSIQAVYTLADGRLVEGPIHGGRGGSRSVFYLDSDEYITGFSGRSGDYIDSLTIQTNKRTSQVFGGRGGNKAFNVNVPAGARAVGFAGRSGEYLDAIGLTYTTGSNTTIDNQRRRSRRF